MVDREARRTYAELVRQFISGRMTNDEYEERFEQLKLENLDPAVDKIFYQVWGLYDDYSTHRMTGDHHLDKAGRRRIAQAILFLQTEEHYCWPELGDADWLLNPLLPLCGIITVALIDCTPSNYLSILSISSGISASLAAFALITRRNEKQAWQEAGDDVAWPFRTQADLAEAKSHPRLLAGRR